jgi:hypothetical protein
MKMATEMFAEKKPFGILCNLFLEAKVVSETAGIKLLK